MRKINFLVCFLLIVFFFSTTVYAHPGKTDSAGGHIDLSTGEYHYHHGYSAHSHYDIDGDGKADCPYNFDDKTDHSSGSNSSSSNISSGRVYSSSKSSSSTKPAASAETDADKEEEVPNWVWWIFAALSCLSVCLAISNKFKKEQINQIAHTARKEEENLSSKINALKVEMAEQEQKQQEKFTEFREQLSLLDSKFKSVCGEDYLYYLVGTPEGDFVGSDGLPRSSSSSGDDWGEKYTFYVSSHRKGTRFHTQSCKHKGSIPINAYAASFDGSFVPCKVCSPSLPDLTWYLRYKEIAEFALKYLNINMLNSRAAEGFSSQSRQPDPSSANKADYITLSLSESVTESELEDFATQKGMSIDAAIFCINFECRRMGIPPIPDPRKNNRGCVLQ